MRRPFSRIESGKGAVTMYIKVIEGESAGDIALRAGCPLCMLLRANGVLSGAWLEMREKVRIPDEDECRKSAFPCPRDFAMGDIPSRIGCIVQKEDDAETIAKAFQLPKRIVLACVHGTVTEGKLLLLPEREEHMTILTVKPGQTWESFAQPQVLMMLNSYFGPLYPGMKLLSIRT